MIEPTTQQGKEDLYLSGSNRYEANQENFSKIPGSPIAYWVSDRALKCFEQGISVNDISDFTGSQHKTADNDRFLRYHWEIDSNDIKNRNGFFIQKVESIENGTEILTWLLIGEILQKVFTWKILHQI